MPYRTNAVPVYAKGTMDVWMFEPNTFDLQYYSNKVQTNSLTTSVSMGEINGSLRNPTLLNLPNDAVLELEIANATSTLQSRKISVGGEITYNGVIPVLETVTADSTVLTVSRAPVAPYGTTHEYAFINKSGEAYTVDPTTLEVSGFTAEPGKTYCVRYFVKNASAKQLKIGSVFEPDIMTCMIRIPLYTVAGGTSASAGTRWGDRYIWIPRMQSTGETGVKGDQTDADSEGFKFRALPYEETPAEGVCRDDARFQLAYMVDMPAEGEYALVKGLAVIGGGISVPVSGSVRIPFAYIMEDGSLLPMPKNEQLEEAGFVVEVEEDPEAGTVSISQTAANGTVVTATSGATDPQKYLHATATKEVGMMPNAGEKEADLIDTTTVETVEDPSVEGEMTPLWEYGQNYTIAFGSELQMTDDGNLVQTYEDGAGYSEAEMIIDDDGYLVVTQTNNVPRYVNCEFAIVVA